MNEIGNRIRQAREAAGLTQQAVADRVGGNRQRIWNWEAGTRTPRTGDLMALADALGVTVGWLLEPKNEKSPPPQ